MQGSSSAEGPGVPVRFLRMERDMINGSEIRLDPMYRMRFDGMRKARATRTRVLVTDPGSREERIVLEGPWITAVAWLSDEYLAVLTRGGRHTLSMDDPDVAGLSSLKNLEPGSGTVTMSCSSLLHILDASEGGGSRLSVECQADYMESVMRGRLLVLRRDPPAPDTWGTLLLGCHGGEIAVVGKLDRDIGPVFMQGEDIVSRGGYRLEGISPALASMKTSPLTKVSDTLQLDPPETSSEEMPVLTGGGIRLEPMKGDIEVPMREHDLARERRLCQGDRIPCPGGGPFFPILRRTGEEYSVSLGRLKGDAASEIVLDVEIRAPHLCYDFTDDRNYMLLSMEGGNYIARTGDGSVKRVAEQCRGVEEALIISSDCFMVLSRLDALNSQLDLWRREDDGWRVSYSLPAEGMNSMSFIRESGLTVLYSSLAPRDEAFALFMLLEADRSLRFIGRIATTVESVEQREGVPVLRSRDGITYGISVNGEYHPSPLPQPGVGFGSVGYTGPLYGYIDIKGDFVIPPSFSRAQGSSGITVAAGLPPHGFVGLFSLEGSTLLPSHASSIDIPSEGFRRVAFFDRPDEEVPEGARWGMIGEDGKWLLPPVYPMISSFQEGRAVVQFGNGDENWIDLKGRRVSGSSFSACGDFHEERASVMRDGLCGYADPDGCTVIDMQYSVALDFSCGAAGVQRVDGKWICIDPLGKVLAGPFNEFYSHSDGLAAVRKGETWTYIDPTGNDPFGMHFQRAYNFVSGLGVIVRGGSWGFVSRDGLLISDPDWDCTHLPSREIGVYSQAGHYGLVNSQGEVLTDPVFTSVRPFRQDLASVRMEKDWGYVDTQGQWAVEPRFFDARDFSCGLAPVQENEGGPWGYIGIRGEWAIPPSFGSCFIFSQGLAVVSP
jgi:hypothetical protein